MVSERKYIKVCKTERRGDGSMKSENVWNMMLAKTNGS